MIPVTLCATLLKLLSTVDILLPALQLLRNNFLKEPLRKTVEATFTCFNVMTFKQPPEMFYKTAIPKNFAILQGKHLCWSLFLMKLLAWRLATLLKRDCNTDVFRWILQIFKGNAQFVQKATFEPLMGFKQNHYGSWKYYKSCYF